MSSEGKVKSKSEVLNGEALIFIKPGQKNWEFYRFFLKRPSHLYTPSIDFIFFKSRWGVLDV